MFELLYYGLMAYLVACFIGSIWALFDPLGFNRFLERKPDFVGIAFFLEAVGAWGMFLNNGAEVFLPFMSDKKTVWDEELGEYVSKKEIWAQSIGYILALIMIGVFSKLGGARMEQQRREEERQRQQDR